MGKKPKMFGNLFQMKENSIRMPYRIFLRVT